MNITILGTGAFGLALAIAFYENNNHICMWTKFEEEKNLLEKERCYEKVLPDIKIPNDIFITTSMEEALKNADIVVVSIPILFIEDTMVEVQKYVCGNEHFVIASKGITTSFHFLDAVIEKYISTKKIAILSGPTFAIDMAHKNPVAFTISAVCQETEKIVCHTLESSFVKLSSDPSLLSVQICGAIKNVMAIGSGIIHGMQFPVSTQAMYLTDALCAMEKLILAFGGDEKVVLSYAGIGDLFLTCMSEKSRNFQLGYLIGSGASFEEVEKYQKETTVEGVSTLESFHQLLKKKGIDIPLIHLLYGILFEKKNKKLFLDYLMNGK